MLDTVETLPGQSSVFVDIVLGDAVNACVGIYESLYLVTNTPRIHAIEKLSLSRAMSGNLCLTFRERAMLHGHELPAHLPAHEAAFIAEYDKHIETLNNNLRALGDFILAKGQCKTRTLAKQIWQEVLQQELLIRLKVSAAALEACITAEKKTIEDIPQTVEEIQAIIKNPSLSEVPRTAPPFTSSDSSASSP